MVNILLSNYDINKDWIINEVKKYVNEYSKVTVIPFSFSSDEIKNLIDWNLLYNPINGYHYSSIVDQFKDVGVKEENIKFLNYFSDDTKTMKQILNNSDVVFFTGGSAELSMGRIKKKDLLDAIRKCKIIIGASAGAMIQLEEYFGSPDDEYPEFKYYPGLGLIDACFSIEVHYQSTESQNTSIQKVLKKGMKTVYGITDNGALIYKDNEVKVFGDVKIFK
ncbi:MAG TPA: Type 1 glutamine amidotransferase-like domain-containing protein [Bacillota bacterium]|nr:Type 1 glutamine amidotransferase-like domain-containing protein [Bacillota bacterium]